MNKRSRATFVLVCLCTLGVSLCGHKEQAAMEETNAAPVLPGGTAIRIKNILNVGSDNLYDENHFFGMIADIRIDDNDIIYVLDGREFNIRLFNMTGSLIKKIALVQGQGPGEYQRPKCMAISKDRIIIGDPDNMRVSIMDGDGKFVESIRTEIMPGEIEVSHDKLYIVGYFDFSKNRVHVYDLKKGQMVRSFASANSMAAEVARFGEKDNIFIRNEFVYLSSFYPYEVRIYSLEGQPIKTMSRKATEFEKVLYRDHITGALRFVAGTSRILVTANGSIINIVRTRNLDTKTASSYMDLFDRQGRWLTTLSAGAFGESVLRLADMNQQNYIVIESLEPFPRVRVFSIDPAL